MAAGPEAIPYSFGGLFVVAFLTLLCREGQEREGEKGSREEERG